MNNTSLIGPHYTKTLDQLAVIENIDDGYTQHAKDFVNWCRAQNLNVTEDTVHDYFVYLNQRHDLANGTKRIKRQVVKKRIRQLLELAPLDDQIRLDRVLSNLDKFGDTRAPKINSVAVGSEKILSPLEVELVLAASTRRIGLMIKFMLSTGCRVGELTGALVGDCEEQGRFYKIRVVGKGNKERHVKIRAELHEQIRETFRGEEYLFEGIQAQQYNKIYVTKQIATLGRKVLNRKISAHCLRHTFATRMIERFPGKIEAISKYLGHSSVAITLDLYCHSTLSDDDLDFIAESTV